MTFFLWSTLARSQDKSPAEWFCFDQNALNLLNAVGKEVPGFVYSELDEDVHQAYNPIIHGVRFKAILSSIFSSDGNFLVAMESLPWLKDIQEYSGVVSKDEVDYKTPEYAKKIFNADAVVTYPFEIEYLPLKARYNHGKMILIHKRAMEGLLILYCFYNDEGVKKWGEYYEGIEQMFRFR